jgi:diacylglycerol kinase (ATP)
MRLIANPQKQFYFYNGDIFYLLKFCYDALLSYKGKNGIKRILNATGYSLAGFKAAFSHEAAF